MVRSASASARFLSCVAITSEQPAARMRCTARESDSRAAAHPCRGSARRAARCAGRPARTAAIAARCRSPVLRSRGSRSARCARPSSAMSDPRHPLAASPRTVHAPRRRRSPGGGVPSDSEAGMRPARARDPHPGKRGEQPGDGPQQRGLAAAVGADERDHLARSAFQADVSRTGVRAGPAARRSACQAGPTARGMQAAGALWRDRGTSRDATDVLSHARGRPPSTGCARRAAPAVRGDAPPRQPRFPLARSTPRMATTARAPASSSCERGSSSTRTRGRMASTPASARR